MTLYRPRYATQQNTQQTLLHTRLAGELNSRRAVPPRFSDKNKRTPHGCNTRGNSPEVFRGVLHLQVLLEEQVAVELQQYRHRRKRPRQRHTLHAVALRRVPPCLGRRGSGLRPTQKPKGMVDADVTSFTNG